MRGPAFLAAATASQQAVLAEREAHAIADDKVIEHADVDQRQRLFQPSRDELVRLARLEHARGVVVREDHRGGVVSERLAQHLPWMDAGAIDGAAEQLL